MCCVTIGWSTPWVSHGCCCAAILAPAAPTTQNLDPSQLDIGILSGAVRLEKLELNPQGLAFLQLPVDVKDGACRSVGCPGTGFG